MNDASIRWGRHQWLYRRLGQFALGSFRFCQSMTAFMSLFLLVFCANQHALAANGANTDIGRFLNKYLSNNKSADKTTRYIVADIPDSNMIIAYISGNFCGSGGCTLLIIEHQHGHYRVINKVTVVKLPIWLLSSSTNGRPDIGVWVQGGGILDGYEALLAFDGKAYPSNPTVPPAKKLAADNTNNKYVLIPKESMEELLFPGAPEHSAKGAR